MRLNVTHKLNAGLALMVLFIVVVGAGGLIASKTISDHFYRVSDDVIPSVASSYQQMVYLEEVNAELFSALSQTRIPDLKKKQVVVKERITQFNEEQAVIAEKVSGNPDLNSRIDEMQKVSQEFFAVTDQVLNDRKQALILEFSTKQAESEFTELTSSLRLWVDDLWLEGETGPRVESGSEDLLRVLEIHESQLSSYESSGELQYLQDALKATDGMFKKASEKLQGAVSSPQQLKRMTREVLNHLYSEAGLVDYYRQRTAAEQKLAANLKQTEVLVLRAREVMGGFIAENMKLASDARGDAEQQEQFSMFLILGLSGVSVAFALAIAVILVKTIKGPLAHIREGLAALREGDLGVSFEVQRQDEFGDLSTYLNSVVEGLKDIVEQVAQGAEQLADVANKNAAISEQTTQSMDRQSEQLEQTSSAAVEMEHSVSEVATHSKTTLKAVHEFEALSRDVNQQMLDTIGSIETQAKGIDQAMGVSKEMSEFGEQIVSILTSIQGIADKTNLLALNAAIEAARAGEQGRGFAVVADEVRALAGQTGDSVQNIQQMIESLQEAIKRVSVVMNQSYKQTQNCVEQAGRSQNVLKSMNEAVAHIRDLNAFIENAASEQSQAVAEVSQTLVSINEAAAETSQGAGSAAKSSHQLLEVVKKQQGLLSRFSV